MKEIKVSDTSLRQASEEGMDAFLKVFTDAIRESIGGELTAETMAELNSDQITLLGYDMLREEVMDGGFVQLIHNGYGGFFFRNPFARAMKQWGMRDLGKMMYAVGQLYQNHGPEIETECTDEEFMAMFERFPEFDEYDDEFVEHEESWTEQIAFYVDEHLEKFATIY